MTMTPITAGNRSLPVDAATPLATGAAPASGRLARLVPATDAVALSATSAAVRDLAAAPPVDRTKVASLKALIADGSYAVDPQAIADKMIALDLL